MSKIQFNELNINASELEILNTQETTNVVGGRRRGRSIKVDIDVRKKSVKKSVNLSQTNLKENTQITFGGGKGSVNFNEDGNNLQNIANINQ